MKKKVFSLMMTLLLAFVGIARADELTVNDGTTTNEFVPVYGFYADAYLKCEFVQPAADLAAMTGATINGVTFYASQSSVSWGANFEVFLTEVGSTTLNNFVGDGTIVYQGALSIVDGMMNVTFTEPYTYNGGNLLFGFYQTATGTYVTSSWYGVSATGASGSGYNYNSLSDCTFGQKNFLPQMTFDYTPAGGGSVQVVDVTIGDPTSTTTNSYLPGYTLYDYAISQQIYTADEIGVGGTINTLTMWLKNNSSYARNINVYMKEVSESTFASNTSWVSMTASDMVASFTMNNDVDTPVEMAIDLSTPFDYSGDGNLVICFQDVTGQWSSGLGGVEMDANGNQALYAYRDGTVYNVSNPGVNGTLLAKKNVVRLNITTTGGGEETEIFAYDMESGLNGWGTIDNDGDGEGWFHSSLSETYSCYDYSGYGHDDSDGFAISASYTDCTNDPIEADNYLVLPRRYLMGTTSYVNFFYDYANDNYPDYFEVCVATTADMPTAADFTQVWYIDMRNGNAPKTQVRYNNNRYENWREVTVNLGNYAGEKVWIAFHHMDYDNFELWIDDVTVNAAYEPLEPITEVYINDFVEPVWGQPVAQEVTLPEDANYTLVGSGSITMPHGREMNPDPIYNLPDQDYYWGFILAPNEGYAFTPDFTAYINDSEDMVLFATLVTPEIAQLYPELLENVPEGAALVVANAYYLYEEGLHTLSTYGVGDNAYESVDRLLIERPNGAWMEPYHFQLYNDGTEDVEVVLIDFMHINGYFSMVEETEYPFTVAAEGRPGVDLYINTEFNWTETAEIIGKLAVNTSERSTHLYQIVAAPYTPYCPDVVEKAYDLGTINGYHSDTYRTSEMWDGPANEYELHANYDLPDYEDSIPDGYDAVMKFTVNRPMNLNARVVEGYEDGKVALYRADFDGEGGPMATNNYTGRPMSGGGITPGGSFEAVIGNVESTTTTYYVPYYQLYYNSISESLYTAAELAAASVTTAPMTSLSWYANSAASDMAHGIQIWMANVSDEALTTTSHLTNGMNRVFSGDIQPVQGWNEFAFNEGSFAWDGHSNVIICVLRNDTEWHSGPAWRAENVGFNAAAYAYSDGTVYNTTTNTYTLYTTNRPIITMKGGNRSNRDEVVFSDDFESILDTELPTGWTTIDADGDGYNWYGLNTSNIPGHSGYGHATSASYSGGVLYPDNYLVSPQVQLGGSITFWACNQDAYPETIGVAVSTTNNTSASAFTTLDSWTIPMSRNGAYTEDTRSGNRLQGAYIQYTIDLSAYAGETGYVAIRHFNSVDQFRVNIDDVEITVPSAPTPVDPDQPVVGNFHYWSAGPEIESLNVVPGTYYLVASSTEADFEVEFNIDTLPCPEKALVLSPVDDADSLDPIGLVLRWKLSPDCIQYRLVFGSTYYPQPGHPQTIITDWTSDLAESYALPQLYNNTNYFWRIEQRTGYSDENPGCVTVSDIWGFTTHLNVPQNLRANDEAIFEDEPLTLTWNPIEDRTYRKYYIYKNEVLYDSTMTTYNPSAQHSYTFPAGSLAYNMEGYTFCVTAVYDEGESAPSNEVTVKVSGYSNTTGINGYAFEQDGETPIAGVTVTLTGTDEFGDPHTYTTTTNANGYYSQVVYAGNYTMAVANKPGYQEAETNHVLPFTVAYNGQENDVNFIMDELFIAPAHVCAQPKYVQGVEGDTLVQVWWDFNFFDDIDIHIDFEDNAMPAGWTVEGPGTWSVGTGDYSTTTGAHGGQYNARCTHATTGNMTYLVSPAMDLAGAGSASVNCWFVNRSWAGDIDGFGVYYRVDGGTWNELYYTTTAHSTWTEMGEIALEGLADNYQLGFLMRDNYGYGVGIDDITITASDRGEAMTRELHHFNIYRTDCYNDGPYNSDNTEFLSTVWRPDTSYMDVQWPQLPAGVYKYGVSAVYAGNRDDIVNYPHEGERESEIVWHNLCSPCIDKDMYIDNGVTVNVVLNSADSPEGTVVTFVNTNEGEQNLHPMAPITLDQTGYYVFPHFRKGDYNITVEKPGYYTYNDYKEIWEPMDLRYVLTEIICTVQNLYVSRTGWAMWDPQEPCPGGAGPTPGPTPGPTGGVIDFNDGQMPEGWTVIENTNTWHIGASDGYSHNAQDGSMLYINGSYGGGYDYFVSPAMTFNGNGSLSFDYVTPDWIGDQNTLSIAYGASATGPWTTIWGPQSANSWTTVNVDLSSLNGTYYIAFVSYNDYGYSTCIDNINLSTSGRAATAERHLEGYKVLCTSIDGEPIFSENTVHNFCQLAINNPDALIPGDTYKCRVAAIYSTGMSEYEEVEWLYQPCYEYAGTLNGVTAEGNTITWDYPGSVPPGPGPDPEPTENATVVLSAPNDIWGDGSGYQMFLDADHTVAASLPTGNFQGSMPAETVAEFEYSIPANADGIVTTSNVISAAGTNSGSVEVPAGTFDILVVNPDGSNVWVVGEGGQYTGIIDDFALEANMTYTFTIVGSSSTGDGLNLVVTDSRGRMVAMGSNGRIIRVTDGRFAEGGVADMTNAPANATGTLEGAINYSYAPAMHNPFRGATAYGNVVYGMTWPNAYVSFDVDAPASVTSVGAVNVNRGGDYADGFFYGYDNNGVFYKINPETGAVVEQHATSHATMTEMAYNYANNTMYAIDNSGDGGSILTTVDLATGNTTVIGTMNFNIMAFAIDLQGNAYGIEITNGNFHSIDLGNAATTQIGATGQAVSYVQCMNFDHNTETLYWFQISSGTDCGLYTVNTGTGATTLLMNTPGEVTSFFVPYEGQPTPPTPPTPVEGILGAMIFVDGEWEAFVEAPINTYTYEGEGENICVRIVYGGTAETPANNFYYAMSCEECVGDDTEMCPAGAPIFGDVDVNDQIRIWWGNDERSWHGKIEKYNVYRSTDNVDYALIGEVSTARDNYYEYFDAPVVGGTYYYQVTAVYSDGCESAPAISGENPDQNYVMFGITGIGENNAEVNLFPNPTMGNVTIQAMNMHRITVVSVLGQVVFDTELDQDEYILNMAKFNTGMYMVRVYTDEGVTVKRVTVLH